MKIQILGSGFAKCQKLVENAKAAVVRSTGKVLDKSEIAGLIARVGLRADSVKRARTAERLTDDFLERAVDLIVFGQADVPVGRIGSGMHQPTQGGNVPG